jgi:Protein SCAI
MLSDAVIVSYRPRQTKVGVLPIDCVRLSQALEWRPRGCVSSPDSSGSADAAPPAPRKVLLFRCTATHFAAAAAAALDGLPSGKLLLLYVGCERAAGAAPAAAVAGGGGAPGRSASTPTATAGSAAVGSNERLEALARAGVLLFPSPKHTPGVAPAASTNAGRADSLAEETAGGPMHARSTLQVREELEPLGDIVPKARELKRDAVSNAECAPEQPGHDAQAQEGSTEDGAATNGARQADANSDQQPPSTAVAAQRSSGPPSTSYIVSAQQMLLPADLQFLTRKRTLIILDSNNSSAFAQLADAPLTHAPLMLLSPSRIEKVHSTADQVQIHLHCSAGSCLQLASMHGARCKLSAACSADMGSLSSCNTEPACHCSCTMCMMTQTRLNMVSSDLMNEYITPFPTPCRRSSQSSSSLCSSQTLWQRLSGCPGATPPPSSSRKSTR